MAQGIGQAWTPAQQAEYKREKLAVEHGFYKLTASRCDHGMLIESYCMFCENEYREARSTDSQELYSFLLPK